MRYRALHHLVVLFLMLAASAMAQTLVPPIAEYRGHKAEGLLELRNDGDVPLAAILEVSGFSVDSDGNLLYAPIAPSIHVQLDANSFVIPPRQSHYVLYKASSNSPNAWFAVMNTMTSAVREPGRMRVNIILPHVVYLYQKAKLKKEDILVRVRSGNNAGDYEVELQNLSDKLGRVDSVTCHGFNGKAEFGGFPVFPSSTRNLTLAPGQPSGNARVKVSFQDGFTIQVPVP